MELGNAIFGNSRGRHPVDRDMQSEWCDLMEACGFDSYGHHDQSDDRCIFENAVFRVQPYYWGDCECSYEASEAAWSKANSHGAECYQTELYGRLGVWEIDNGYAAAKQKAYGSNGDDFFAGFDATHNQVAPDIVASVFVPRTDDAIKALNALDKKRDKARDGIIKDLCARHGLDRRYGCMVHCTCDFQDRWSAFLAVNSHAPDCRIATPNFTHKPSGFTLEWYKYPLRDSYSSAALTPELMRSMWAECAASMSALATAAREGRDGTARGVARQSGPKGNAQPSSGDQ